MDVGQEVRACDIQWNHHQQYLLIQAQARATVPKLEEGDDIEQYPTTFERLAAAYRWPRAEWAVYLVPYLTGRARAAYVAMDILEAMDYSKVREAILSKYEISKEIYKQRFRDPDVRPGETPKELYNRLKDNYRKWIKTDRKTVEEIGELLILEQYLCSLDPDMRVWVKEHNPTSCGAGRGVPCCTLGCEGVPVPELQPITSRG